MPLEIALVLIHLPELCGKDSILKSVRELVDAQQEQTDQQTDPNRILLQIALERTWLIKGDTYSGVILVCSVYICPEHLCSLVCIHFLCIHKLRGLIWVCLPEFPVTGPPPRRRSRGATPRKCRNNENQTAICGGRWLDRNIAGGSRSRRVLQRSSGLGRAISAVLGRLWHRNYSLHTSSWIMVPGTHMFVLPRCAAPPGSASPSKPRHEFGTPQGKPGSGGCKGSGNLVVDFTEGYQLCPNQMGSVHTCSLFTSFFDEAHWTTGGQHHATASLRAQQKVCVWWLGLSSGGHGSRFLLFFWGSPANRLKSKGSGSTVSTGSRSGSWSYHLVIYPVLHIVSSLCLDDLYWPVVEGQLKSLITFLILPRP